MRPCGQDGNWDRTVSQFWDYLRLVAVGFALGFAVGVVAGVLLAVFAGSTLALLRSLL